MLSAPGQPPEFDADATVSFFREMAVGKMPFVVHEGSGGPDGAEFVCGFLMHRCNIWCCGACRWQPVFFPTGR